MRITKIFGSLFFSLLLSISGLVSLGVAQAAGPATISLVPSTGSYNIGSTLSLDIHEDSGSTSVYSVRVAITYPASSLNFVGFTPNSAAFSINPTNKGGGGTAEYEAATTTPVTGDQLVATLVFTATQGSGTATVTVNGPDNSNIQDQNASSVQGYTTQPVEELGSVSGGSYTLTGSSSSGGGTSSSGGGTSSSGSGSSSSSSSSGSTSTKKSTTSNTSTSTSTKTPSPPAANNSTVTISGVKVTDVSTDTATVSWQTSAATTSEVDYGYDTTYGLSATSGTMTTNHSLALNSDILTAGTLYHFRVKGVDGSGNVVSGDDMTFRTTGGTKLTVTVLDQHNKAVKGAVVSTAGVAGTTDSNGKAVLADLPAGTQTLAISFNGTTTKSLTTINASDSAQSVTVHIKVPASKTTWIIPVIIVALLALLLVFGRYLMANRRDHSSESSRHFPNLPGGGTAGPSATGGGGSVITPGGGSATTPPGGAAASTPGKMINPTVGPSGGVKP